jgi:hypothetical protein
MKIPHQEWYGTGVPKALPFKARPWRYGAESHRCFRPFSIFSRRINLSSRHRRTGRLLQFQKRQDSNHATDGHSRKERQGCRRLLELHLAHHSFRVVYYRRAAFKSAWVILPVSTRQGPHHEASDGNPGDAKFPFVLEPQRPQP